jgi:hypothetical protein
MRVRDIFRPILAFPAALLIASETDAHPLLPGIVIVVSPGLGMDAIVMGTEEAFAAVMRYPGNESVPRWK